MHVLIVDDDSLIRDGLKMMVSLEDDIENVGTAKNGEEAIRYCMEAKPDVVVMDIRMPIMDGVLATKKLKEMYSDIKIIILTTFNDKDYLREAVSAGAEGYILKSQPADQIIANIRSVHQGHVVFEKEVSLLLKELMKEKEKPKMKLDHLTEKELNVIRCIGEGMSNKEIAAELFVGEGTVRNYISAILDKLNLRDRTQLAIYYIRYIENS